jgi:hypothetical protein
MKRTALTVGTLVYDFFLLPTIRYEHHGDTKFVTFEWLRWYVGIMRYRKET